MKNYKRSIISGVLVFAMCMGTVMRVQATTIEEAQEKASQLDEAGLKTGGDSAG